MIGSESSTAPSRGDRLEISATETTIAATKVTRITIHSTFTSHLFAIIQRYLFLLPKS